MESRFRVMVCNVYGVAQTYTTIVFLVVRNDIWLWPYNIVAAEIAERGQTSEYGTLCIIIVSE